MLIDLSSWLNILLYGKLLILILWMPLLFLHDSITYQREIVKMHYQYQFLLPFLPSGDGIAATKKEKKSLLLSSWIFCRNLDTR